MKIIQLEQGSKEWLDFRKSHITGTDCSAILGKNPWTSPKKIWKQKLGLIEPDKVNKAMEHGTFHEPIARDLLIKETGIQFEPIVAVHDTYEWAMSSLDGYCPINNVICEIKCPVKIDGHQLAWEQQIKEYYIAQIQHALWVTNASLCYFCSYMPTHSHPLIIVQVKPDEEYIVNMIEIERMFYETWIKYPNMFDNPPEDGFKFKIKTPSH